MSSIIECKHAGVYVEAMRLQGNAEQVLGWIVGIGNLHGDSSVLWESDDNGPIYFNNADGQEKATKGQYVALCSDGQFRAFDEKSFREQFDTQQEDGDELHQEDGGGLYGGSPECKHEIVEKWSGIECKKCDGWFCS